MTSNNVEKVSNMLKYYIFSTRGGGVKMILLARPTSPLKCPERAFSRQNLSNFRILRTDFFSLVFLQKLPNSYSSLTKIAKKNTLA